MNFSADKGILLSYIERADFESYAVERYLALYSAAICISEEEILSAALELGKKNNLKREQFYEIVLQSYLFLGFPRMLIAAQNLNEFYPKVNGNKSFEMITPDEAEQWFKQGTELCRKVYNKMYEPLKDNVISFAPEIFRWMVIEGYGKVLSREVLDIKIRELSIISFLMMENRPSQLHSHIKGAVNVGVDSVLLKTVIDDIGEAAGDGYQTALNIYKQVGMA